MHTGLNDNPFLAPKDTTSGVSSDRPNQRVARIISYAALVMLLSCFVCFALSTYQVAMILGVKDYKGYFAPLLFWAVLSWFFATLLATLAVMFHKSSFNLFILCSTQIPLLLPAWIVAIWFWNLFAYFNATSILDLVRPVQ